MSNQDIANPAHESIGQYKATELTEVIESVHVNEIAK